ncbi:hypothetical protein Droror1_Dr00021605, partial [Drosera rotundifolia]
MMQPCAGFALFESESLKWPRFVEFDDVNGKVLTYSAQDSVYKLFDLKNYALLYSISDNEVDLVTGRMAHFGTSLGDKMFPCCWNIFKGISRSSGTLNWTSSYSLKFYE